MGVVTIMCPLTGKNVSTGTVLDRVQFRTLRADQHFVFHCWLCGHQHDWSKRWAILLDERDPLLHHASPP